MSVQPAGTRIGSFAPAFTVAATPGEPSAFMTTTDQSPSRTFQSSAPPVDDATQIDSPAGGAIRRSPGRSP